MTIQRFIKICCATWLLLLVSSSLFIAYSGGVGDISSSLLGALVLVSFPFFFAVSFIAMLVGFGQTIFWGYKTFNCLKSEIPSSERFWIGTRLMLRSINLTEQGKEYRILFIRSYYWFALAVFLAAPLLLMGVVFSAT
ncbi:MAG: hypothetical protein ACKVI8_22765 [Paraglaciecola sp.]|jgi:hypothetical protein